MAEIQSLVLDGVYAEIAGFFGGSGHEIAMTLARHFGGQNIYFPKLDRTMLPERDRRIREEFTGRNHKFIARRYNLSVQRVRDIVGAK